jgi:tetratricopeptide (TPR) repeat protein
MKHLMAWMATAAVLHFALPADVAQAAQDNPALDGLFTRLKSEGDPRTARIVEAAIWQIWLQSGDPEVDKIMQRGIGAMNDRDLSAALAAFDEVVERAPDFAEGWNKRATVHYFLQNYDQSIADIQRTLVLEPRHFGALSGLGLVSLAMGQEVQALQAFEEAVKIYPSMHGLKDQIKELRERVKGKGI